MAGLMDVRRQILLNTPHLATASGDIVTFQTDMLIPLKSVTPSSNATITQTGKNLWGDLTMAQSFSSGVTGYSIDTVNKTFTFQRATSSPYNVPVFTGPFKANTMYTILAQYSNGGTNSSLRVRYTDNTFQNVTFNNSSSTKKAFSHTTTANKTVENIYMAYVQTAKTTIYYEESGVFEGVLTYDDFEAYKGQTFAMPATITAFAGTNNIWSDSGNVEVKYWTHI